MSRTNEPPRPLDLEERTGTELLIAGGRLLLASAALLAIWIGFTDSRSNSLAYGLLISYSVYALAFFLSIHRFGVIPGNRFILVAHAIDLLWPALISLFTEGPNSPSYLLYLWVLLAAAYRWGLKRTLITAGICIALLLAEAGVLSSEPIRHWLQAEYDLNRLITRAIYLLVMAAAIGYVSEREKQIRAATSLITNLVASARVDWGLTRSLQVILSELNQAFEASTAILICRSKTSHRAALLKVTKASPSTAAWQEVATAQAASYFELPFPPSLKQDTGPGPPDVAILTEIEVYAQGSLSWASLFGKACSRVLLAQPAELPDWEVRLYLLNPASSDPAALRLLRRVVIHVTPGIYNLYLMWRLRSRAEALQRSRIARELHDGPLQSLFAMRLQLGALRRRHVLEPEIRGDLDRIERLLRTEMVELRGLMQRMSDADVEPGQLIQVLDDTVEKFMRESGMDAVFSTNCAEVQLPSRTCRELVRITEEALVNIYKHSGAKSVEVMFREMHGIYFLKIKDDGRGFDFDGRVTASELERMHKGPLVIRRRSEAIGAQLTIESKSGCGSVLELVLLSADRATHV